MGLIKRNLIFICLAIAIFAGVKFNGSYFVGFTSFLASFFVLGFVVYIHEERAKNRMMIEELAADTKTVPSTIPDITEENLSIVVQWFIRHYPGNYQDILDADNLGQVEVVVKGLKGPLTIKDNKDLLGTSIEAIYDLLKSVVNETDESLPKHELLTRLNQMAVLELTKTILCHVFLKTHGEDWDSWYNRKMAQEIV